MSEYIKGDQSFDAIAEKFQRNIYGTSKGKLRHELLLHYLTTTVLDKVTGPIDIIDVGGGTGVMAAELANMGHLITLNDVSEDCLSLARHQFPILNSASLVHGPLQTLENQKPRDLVICHAVLEWLKNPIEALSLLSRLVKPGGYLSLSFFNKDAQRFGNVLYGNFDYVQADLKVKKKVRLNPNQALEPDKVLDAMSCLPLSVVHKAGIRCFHDYLKERENQENKYEQLKAIELEFGSRHPYLWLGKYFHIIARRDG